MLQTNDRVGRCVTAQALLEESQPCHDRSAEMQVTFLKKHPNKGGLWRNQEEKRSSKRKPWLQALPGGSPTPPLPLCFCYKARARGKPRGGEQGWLRPWGCRLWAAGLAVAAAAEPMQRPGMGLPVLGGCGCTRPGCPGIGKR